MGVKARYLGVKPYNEQTSIVSFAIHNVDMFVAEPKSIIELEVKKFREKRSLNANAYYQELCGKVSQEMGISEAEYHNKALAEMGVIWKDENNKPDFILHIDNNFWLKVLKGENHYAPTEHTETIKNTVYRWFVRVKPSREYDTKEMSSLIDYVVQDANEIGIETRTPAELKALKEAWGNDRQ